MLVEELGITMANADVWLSIGLALVLGCACLVFGTWVARTVGLLRSDAPAGETLGVGLASGLIVLAAWWAAIWSGGRSSFTPVALGFALAISVAIVGRVRRRPTVDDHVADPTKDDTEPRARRAPLIRAAIAGGLFVVAIALLYGSTLAPSPRDGRQPAEFTDEAFYAVLGRDLAATGTETTLSATGFPTTEVGPSQTWYHWGELWLASAVISVFGTAPMAARYFVVLPLVMLASAALAGTLVRRLTGWDSRRGFLYGFVAYLFLAPVPLTSGPFLNVWAAAGMVFSINLYGLAAVAVLLALYGVAVLSTRRSSWALAIFAGCEVAVILPAHLAIAILVAVGVGSVWALRIGQSLAVRRPLPDVPPAWRKIIFAAGIAGVGTIAWGVLTGHSMGGGGPLPALVPPFNASWRESIALTVLGGGAFLAILVALPLVYRDAPLQADLFVGTLALLVAGAIAWGARLGDFTMFYLFFGGIAVLATPVAVIAVRALWERLRVTRHMKLAAAVVVLCVIQLEWGAWNSTLRMQQFGPSGSIEPIPVSLLDAIRRLPPDAELAYSCSPYSEISFGVPELLTIDAHAGRRVVPICFNAEVLSTLSGAEPSETEPNLYFASAPQRVLYPDPSSDPSSASVSAFLKEHGIGYIFADAQHPNTLVDDAIPIASSGDAMVLKVP